MLREEDIVFAPGSADPAQVARALATHGVALLRGVLPTKRVVSLGRRAEAYFRHLDARIRSGESDDAIELFKQYCNVAIASTQTAAHTDLFDVFGLVDESALVPCLEAALGGEPFVPFQYCLVRRVFATQIREAAPFHQDISPIGPDVPVSCWVPLTAR